MFFIRSTRAGSLRLHSVLLAYITTSDAATRCTWSLYCASSFSMPVFEWSSLTKVLGYVVLYPLLSSLIIPRTIFALQEVSFTPPRRIQMNRSMNEVREKKRSWSRIEHRLGAKVRFTFSAISSKRIDRSLKSILFTQMIRQIILEKAADVIFIAELGT